MLCHVQSTYIHIGIDICAKGLFYAVLHYKVVDGDPYLYENADSNQLLFE